MLGISGISSDMRGRLKSVEPSAQLAVDYFVYQAVKEIGALAAVLGGIDGLVLTAGIGENSVEIRRRIIRALAHGLYCLASLRKALTRARTKLSEPG